MLMSFLQKLFTRKHEADEAKASFSRHEYEGGTAATVPVLQLADAIEKIAPEHTARLLPLLRGVLADPLNENLRFQAAEALAAAVYPKYKFSEYGRIFLEDEEFLRYYMRFMDVDNWHSLDRKYTLDQLLKQSLHLNGDIAECGVWKGDSAYLMCQAHRNSGRVVHLFDSFEGLSNPDSRDGNYWVAGALSSPEQVLRDTLSGFGNYRAYKGWIPERFGEVADKTFSFVHVDVDLYQPTFQSLSFFYGRIEPEGMILMDDYGFNSCPGAKRAADEFFSDKPEQIMMLSTGQAFVVKR